MRTIDLARYHSEYEGNHHVTKGLRVTPTMSRKGHYSGVLWRGADTSSAYRPQRRGTAATGTMLAGLPGIGWVMFPSFL